MKRYFDTLHWRNLGDMSFRHKAFLLVLESVADPAGVVIWNPAEFEGLTGERFHKADIAALGDSHAVWMDRDRILLPGFMRFQYGTLSRRSPAHVKVWRALREHWPADVEGEGGEDEDDLDPHDVDFSAVARAWKALGVLSFLPDVQNERHPGHEPVWYRDAVLRADAACSSQSYEDGQLDGIPISVMEPLMQFFRYRQEKVVAALSKSDAIKWEWTTTQADAVINWTKDMLEECSERQVATALRRAVASNYKMPYDPRGEVKVGKEKPHSRHATP